MTNRYKLLVSGCGSAGRNVAKVATTDGRGVIVGLADPQPSQLDKMLTDYPEAPTGADYVHLLRTTQPDVVVNFG